MKKIFLAAAINLIIAGTSLPQNEPMFLNNEKIVEVNMKERNPLTPINEVCPIEGKKIDHKIPYLIFGNKIIGFCCPGCDNAFLKNPKLYEEKLNKKEK